jgi:hypothetical protein
MTSESHSLVGSQKNYVDQTNAINSDSDITLIYSAESDEDSSIDSVPISSIDHVEKNSISGARNKRHDVAGSKVEDNNNDKDSNCDGLKWRNNDFTYDLSDDSQGKENCLKPTNVIKEKKSSKKSWKVDDDNVIVDVDVGNDMKQIGKVCTDLASGSKSASRADKGSDYINNSSPAGYVPLR